MSDNFEMLVDIDATPEEAKRLSRAVLDRFRKLGLITGRPNGGCVLGGKGYNAGPAIPRLYKPTKGEGRFWNLITSGVEASVGRAFNVWSLGVCRGFVCPSCQADNYPFSTRFGDAVREALNEWVAQSGSCLVKCPKCRKRIPITSWQPIPPFGFGNLSFTFWNWPAFRLPSWRIDIPKIVEEMTKHRIIRTYGHI